MATYNTITYSNLDVSRIDGEFYQKRFVENEAFLCRVKSSPVTKAFGVIPGQAYPSKYFKDGGIGIPVFKIADVVQKTPLSELMILDPKGFQLFPQLLLKDGDILMSGTHHNAWDLAKVRQEYFIAADYTINQRVFVLRRTDNLAFSNYAYAFFHTKFARAQFERWGRGNNQLNLNLYELAQIRIPLIDDTKMNEISDYVQKFHTLTKRTLDSYSEARQLLEAELGLDKFHFQRPLSYETRLSQIVGTNRADAQCYKPEYSVYERFLRERGSFDILKNLLIGCVKGIRHVTGNKGSAVFASIKHIKGHEIITDEKCVEDSATPSAEKRDLLLAITGATIGKIGIVHRYKSVVFSGDLLALKTNETIDPSYLLCVLDGPIGRSQCNRWISGSTNGHLAPLDVRRLVVPRLDSNKEASIARLVTQSLDSGQQSEQLLEQAKNRVEQLIEEAVQK